MTKLMLQPQRPIGYSVEPEEAVGQIEQDPNIVIAKFLFDGLAAQFPSGTFAKFISNPKIMATWALAFEKHGFTKDDCRKVLQFIASDNVQAHEVTMGRVIEIARGDKQQRAFRRIAGENDARYALPKPKVDREKVEAALAACRAALSSSKPAEMPSKKYDEPADEKWWISQCEMNNEANYALPKPKADREKARAALERGIK